MINADELKNELLKQLNYTESPGLRSAHLWPNGREIEYVKDIYYIQGVPVAYFSCINTQDTPLNVEEVWRLHCSVWSQSKVPLLYVITPQDIRIYNGYAEPSKSPENFELERSGEEDNNRLLRHLRKLEDVEVARQEITQQLRGYRRLDLETGAFWHSEDGRKIKRESRADQRLLHSMHQVRRRLLTLLPKDSKLSKDIAYALLGRSIFISYLQDRGILTEDWMMDITKGRVARYLAALSDKDTTYDLFEYLSQRFNGDLFPLDKEGEERKIVGKDHLELIAQFLQGYDFDAQQFYLWPYDFSYIPIELISGIYDTFLYSGNEEDSKSSDKEEDENDEVSKQREEGAYYTPLPLVEFIIEETLPLEIPQPNYNTKVLDPACGSGVFLVRAYQRLIDYWKRQHNYKRPNTQELKALLEQNIFGVDIEPNAVQIAAFSLHLAMMDYLTNAEILEKDFRFSKLIETNLITGNFLLEGLEKQFAERNFDRIIGNPPWGKNTLKDEAEKRAKELNYEIGDGQIVQAFLQHAYRFCKEHSEIALLAPAKCTISLSPSSHHKKFYDLFFSQYDVRAVVNFTVLRHELFINSISPAVALFYRPHPPSRKKIVYGTPKPSLLSSRLGAIILDATEVKYLDRSEVAAYPFIWKIASWGIARDVALIKRLISFFPSLEDLENSLQWKISRGFFKGKKGKKQEASWLNGKPLIDANKFRDYYVEPDAQVQGLHFERPRTLDAYCTPLIIIRRSKCKAAFFDAGLGFVAYRDTLSGVVGLQGQEYLLKWLVAYINSPLARYYHFLTSSRWGVERDATLHDEFKAMPFLIPKKENPLLQKVLQYVDEIISLYRQHDAAPIKNLKRLVEDYEEQIAELVFDLYELTETERQQVRDVLHYEVEFFNWSTRKDRDLRIVDAIKPLDAEQQIMAAYAETFIDVAKTLLQDRNQTLNTTIYQDGTPLSVIAFKLANLVEAQPVQIKKQSTDVEDILSKLDHWLLEQRAATLYTRRHVRIFDGPYLYMIRPSERRFWTRSQAIADADALIAELLVQSKKAIMGVPL